MCSSKVTEPRDNKKCQTRWRGGGNLRASDATVLCLWRLSAGSEGKSDIGWLDAIEARGPVNGRAADGAVAVVRGSPCE